MRDANLPGAELIEAGLVDLATHTETDESLLVWMAAPRLRALGFDVPAPFEDAELRLYRRLAARHGAAAHGRYNALVRRLVSFQTGRRMRAVADKVRIEAFLTALARAATTDTGVFLVGGTTAVLVGWRPSTIDIDLVIRPESDAMLRAIPSLKERLNVNVKLASPDQFIPVPAGWEERSPVIARAMFPRMEPQLYRFPAIDPPSFRRAVNEAFPP